MKFVNGLVVNEANVLHYLAHLCFILIFGLRLLRHSTNTKRYPLQKSFWNPWICFQPELSGKRRLNNIQLSSNIAWSIQFWKKNLFCRKFRLGEQTQGSLSKIFLRGNVFVEYFSNRRPKVRTKNFKSYISILIIVNYRNWLNQCRRCWGLCHPSPKRLLVSPIPFRFTQNTFVEHHVTTRQ